MAPSTSTTDRNRAPLVWGSLLLGLGLLWLLLSVGGMHGRLAGATMAAGLLGGMSAVLYVTWNRDRHVRPFALIASGALAALALAAFGGILGLLPEPVGAALFFAGVAVPAAALYRRDPSRRWAATVAWVTAVLGATTLVERVDDDLAGAFFLWGVAAFFLWMFLRSGSDRALVASGVLATVGLTSLVEAAHGGDRLQAVAFLLGLAATFAALHLLGRPGRGAWSRHAATGCAALALVVLLAGPAVSVVLPLALIACGLYLIFVRGRRGQALPDGPPGA